MRESYWQRDAAWCDEWRDTVLPRTVDVAVLGGGLSGLATAIALRQRNPGADIVLVEAERVGYGASGRSAGFLSPLAAPVWLLGAHRSSDHAWAAAQINREVHAAARWIGEHLEDTELTPTILHLTSTGRMSGASLGEFADALRHTGLPFEYGVGGALARDAPRLPFLQMDAYTVHPYKLVRGLARHAVRQGVRIRERARVRAIERTAQGSRLRFEVGNELVARTTVVCTNAYTSSIDTGERVRAVALHSFMFASQPVPELAASNRFAVEVNSAQAYHRMHRDRLLYGGIDHLTAPEGGEFAFPESVRAQLGKLAAQSFPGRSITPAEGWSGKFHATTNGLPIIRRSPKNPALVFNVGYGGTGFALALACGKLAAAVASDGTFASAGEERMHDVIRETRVSVRDTARAGLQILRRFAG